jgi:hypothetical protein
VSCTLSITSKPYQSSLSSSHPGHNQVPQPALLSMVELFETRVEGQVNYMNFLEFVRECGTSSALDTLSKQLHR